ncbi:uncharacterized membrane protein HdeD (DUF308 family) [Rhizobium petrolearium]|uniref:DUF2157 domain-containing protein n=2 Tax=Neorhizobium TaxID=1525371 RepID=A0ABV0MC04_9HYPH|nr:hypothetical protein [Neorhizobium petrolearium]MBP1848305.1 uncharacterized membrane protein HdeD (DUF308 family) [Neorhizobium petrolearium]MCC2614461.1 hypothetical protein [Neorhizobium petrolearium]WGI72227.1 hypothetical protein QEO92_32210 [Neorhizobium petrolearium]
MFIRAAASRKRRKISDRFQGPYDGGRLFVVGIILVDMATVAFANSFFGRLAFQYWPGMASVFGGLLLAIIIIRLGRPKLYFDWIIVGILHLWLGLILTNDPLLASTWSLASFYVILAASAALTTWIGVTIGILGDGGTWLVAGGLASFVCAVVGGIINGWTDFSIEPDVILGTNLLLLGLAIGGLGLSLRKTLK